MKLLAVILSAGLLSNSFAYAQDPVGRDLVKPPDITPPSPNASAFTKYGDIPVSLYTGVPNISIPLHQIQARDIHVSVDLSYHASGIKVSEEASRVGLGWTLNCGGAVSRTIIGRDDLDGTPESYLFPRSQSELDAVSLPNGITTGPSGNAQRGVIAKFHQNVGVIQKNLMHYISDSNDPIDFQPDVFNYNFNGHSGRFILDRKRNAIIGKQEKLKVEIIDVGTLRGGSIKITDDKGFVYLFDAVESVKENGEGGFKISTWYMTKITSPQNEEVTFHYTNNPSASQAELICSVGQYYEMTAEFYKAPDCLTSQLKGQSPVATIAGQKFYTSIYLDRVEWNNGRIEFDIENRDDLQNDIRIKSMQFFKSKTSLDPYEEVVFDYDYFESIAATSGVYSLGATPDQYRTKRLKLQAVRRRALPFQPNFQEEIHSFIYNELMLPPKNSFARDHWGYFNGRIGNVSLIPTFTRPPLGSSPSDYVGVMGKERDPDINFMAACVLTSITYPTKGSTNFYYGANTYGTEGSVGSGGVSTPTVAYQVATSLLYNATPGQWDSDELDISGEYMNNNNTPLDYVYIRTGFTVSGGCDGPVGSKMPFDMRYELHDESGSLISTVQMTEYCNQSSGEYDCMRCNNGVFKLNKRFLLPRGKYTVKSYLGAGVGTSPTPNVNPNTDPLHYVPALVTNFGSLATWMADPRLKPNNELDNTERHYQIGGGLRIERIEDVEPEVIGGTTNIRKYQYHSNSDPDNDGITDVYSYGKQMVAPRYTFFDVNMQTSGTDLGDHCTQCIYLIKTSDASIPLANADGYSIAYSNVTEIFGAAGEHGHTIYEYENEVDDVLDFFSPQSDQGVWLRPPAVSSKSNPTNGMTKSVTQYTSANKRTKRTENVNTAVNQDMIYGLEVRKMQVGEGALNDTSIYIMLIYPSIRSQFIYTSEATEISYNTDDIETVKMKTSTFFENLEHLQPTRKVVQESNGHLTTTRLTYPLDYTEAQRTAAMNGLVNNHMHSAAQQISVVDGKYGVDQVVPEAEVLVSRVINIYGLFGNKPLISQKAIYESTLPHDPDDIPSYDPQTFTFVNNQNYKKGLEFAYDTDYNVSRLTRYSDIPSAFLYGYNKDAVVAVAKNAQSTELFYNSFEESGGVDMIISGINAAKSGNKVYDGSSFTFPANSFTVTANTMMSYSYWDGSKWNYSGVIPYQATITVNGASKLDEIRAFPRGSQMTTYTQDTAWGTTSVTDMNGLTTSYEYDERGRLAVVRDNDKKIVKRYTYKFKR